MTTIIGLIDSSTAYIAADKQISYGSAVRSAPTQKYFHLDHFLIAVAGPTRLQQLLQHNLTLPTDKEKPTIHECLQHFIRQIRDLLEEWQCVGHNEEGRPCMPGSLLVMNHGSIWHIDGDLCISPVRDFIAIGSGWQFASGSLHTTAGNPFPGMPSENKESAPRRIALAMKSAAAFDLYTGSDYDIEITETKQ